MCRSRGYTHTIANLTSNLCWFIITKTFKDLQEQLGLAAPFFLYGGVCVFGLIFVFVFLPETRGKTYEETALEFQVVLQKVASELHPKVRNHGEGPY